MTDKRQNSEFQEFMVSDGKGVVVPERLNQAVPRQIHRRVRREGWLAITRFAAVHFLSAFATLLVCPQFGLGPVAGFDISVHLMAIGPWACAIFCACVFFGVGVIISGWLLSMTDLRRLATMQVGIFVSYVAVVGGLLTFLGREKGLHVGFYEAEFIVIWSLAGILCLWLGFRFMMKSRMHLV
jgi:hypothetical protein